VIRVVTICGYLACDAAAVVVEVLARRDRERVAPLGDLMDQVMATRSARLGILLFWWWAGWHFLVGQTV
jgi:hypothetical protein